MNNKRFDVINKIYKPKKYIIKGKTIHLIGNENEVLLKEKNLNIQKVHNYLKSCDFNNYVPIIDSSRENFDVYPYIKENNIPIEKKGSLLIRNVSLMHTKTSFNKEVDIQKYDDIYNDLLNNILYLEDYYSTLYDKVVFKRFYTPFENIFIDNYSKINNAILFCKKELDEWYSLVSDKKCQRVCLVHGNLSLDHFIKSDNDFLISFDNAKFETPILDIVSFYKKEYKKLDFKSLFNEYLYHMKLTEDEEKLLFILISLPDEIKISNNNFLDMKSILNMVNYLNITEELIRPYYFHEDVEE